MIARTKTEKEVEWLSRLLPPISESQKQWAINHFVDYKEVQRFRGKSMNVIHFIIATTKDDWQILRHFYLYATFRYKKLHKTEFAEVMQSWYSGGRYAFMSRSRCMGYCSDNWSLGQPMEIRRGEMGGYIQLDPRELGYDGVKYAARKPAFKYIPTDVDKKTHINIDKIYRALNISPYNETLLKQRYDVFTWGIKNEFLYDKELSAAIKIAIRYKYDKMLSQTWQDMVEMLHYLGKDLHNPKIVCPDDLERAHNEASKAATNKRMRAIEKMKKVRQIAEEKRRLREIERREWLAREQKRRIKSCKTEYIKKRKKFFGIVIAGKGIEIKVLQSVDEFFQEGKELEHCVFGNAYYDVRKKPDCLILSAKVNGKRTETIEVNLRNYNVVQCHGKLNNNSKYHDTILQLMNDNMNKIKKCNKAV